MNESSKANSLLLKHIANTRALLEVQEVGLERRVDHGDHLICGCFEHGIDQDAQTEAANPPSEEVPQICDRG